MEDKLRTRKEIVDKEEEIYELINKNKIDAVRGILYTDALEWVLGEDYLDFDDVREKNTNGNS